MASKAERHVLTSLKGSLKSGQYSDLKITCGSDSYNVHKVIVCEQAEFFARAIKFGGQESSEGKIDLPEDEAPTIELLIQYLYEGDYDPQLPDWNPEPSRPKTTPGGQLYDYDFPHTCKSPIGTHYVCPHHTCSWAWHEGVRCGYICKAFVCEKCDAPLTGDSSQLLLHARMYEIADKYQAAGLKDLAAEKFRRACCHFWNEPDFADATLHAFSTTLGHDKGLRDIVTKVFLKHMKELIKKPDIEILLTDLNGLAFSLLKLKTEADE